MLSGFNLLRSVLLVGLTGPDPAHSSSFLFSFSFLPSLRLTVRSHESAVPSLTAAGSRVLSPLDPVRLLPDPVLHKLVRVCVSVRLVGLATP